MCVFSPARTVGDCFKFRNKMGGVLARRISVIAREGDGAWPIVHPGVFG